MKRYRITIFVFLFIYIFSLFNFSLAEENNLTIYSPSAILIESSTGKILYEKNAYDRMYPASTTKIMTAILTIENCKLTDTAIVSKNAIDSIPYSYTTAYLKEGEELTINDLLHVLLIVSANDAANVLAEHIAGSVENFSSMMNTKAKELGCIGTNFVNPSGIHDENHYSTSYDLSVIAKYAMKNETFRQIVSKKDCKLPASNVYPENNRYFKTTNLLLREDVTISGKNYFYEYCNGIKTGYTDPAKDCIVASSNKDGLEVILVLLGADKAENNLNARYQDCITLFEYANSNYSMYKVHNSGDILKQIKILNGKPEANTLNLVVQDEMNVFLDNINITDSTLTPSTHIKFGVTAPITKGSIVGTVTYTIDNFSYTSNLLAGNDIEESKLFSNIYKFLVIFTILIIFYELIKLSRKKYKKRGRN